MSPHIAHLRIAATAAAQHHAARAPRRTARMSLWMRRRDNYLAVRDATQPHDPRHERARMLGCMAGFRALAWSAILDGDAEAARKHHGLAHAMFAAAMAVRVA